MKDKDIEYITTIAQTGSITKAAEQLFIAQPSLTQFLHRLEEEYDATFFKRSKDGIKLTHAGQLYLEAARNISETFTKMQEEIGVLSNAALQLDVGITSFLGSILMSGFVRGFKEALPEASIRFIENSSEMLEDLAAEGRIDYAVLHSPVSNRRLDYFPLYGERFLLAVSENDPDCAGPSGGIRPTVTKELMAKKSFVMLSSNQRNRQTAERICLSAGIVPKIAFTTTSFTSALSLAQDGIGAAFVPESYARYFGRSYKLRYLAFPETWAADWQLVIAYPRGTALSDTALRSVTILQDCIKNMPEVFVQ